MKLYRLKITPLSFFATPLRGDTLFGHLCWAILYQKGEERLRELLNGYDEGNPFAIVSDAFAAGYLPKPHLPFAMLGEKIEEKKRNRKRKWIAYEALKAGRFSEAVDDEGAGAREKSLLQVHNALDYRTLRTGHGADPHGLRVLDYGGPKVCRDLYVAIDETRWNKEEMVQAFETVAAMGYGKKSSTGKGRFTIDWDALETLDTMADESTRMMALSPFDASDLGTGKLYAEPFVRFGRHGGQRARGNPFKKPLLLADTGAVIEWDTPRSRLFVGKGIKGHSAAYPDTVHQGYAITVALGGER